MTPDSKAWQNGRQVSFKQANIQSGSLMVDRGCLKLMLHSVGILNRETALTRLTGDASNRTYYRIALEGGQDPPSLILMVLNDPEAFKQSEEAAAGPPLEVTEPPFINVHRHLQRCGIAVPALLSYNREKGWLLLEDLGDLLLSRVIEKNLSDEATISSLYQKAIDLLIQMQQFASPVPSVPTVAHSRRFEPSLFMWEFDHFLEYGIEKRAEILLPNRTKQAMKAAFAEIVRNISAPPYLFTHRDYHSRNIMIQENGVSFKIRLLDFQDALMGPQTYDLASLLRDSYLELSEAMTSHLVEYYLAGWKERTGEKIPKESFRDSLDWMALQRNLKAVGRFIYIDRVKKNPAFLPWVSPTLKKVKKTLKQDDRLALLDSLLSPFVEELQ